jgi:hypothetical protein
MDTYRYLILTEGQFGPQSSKTATSAIRYLPERVVGVLDSAHAGKTAWEVIGLGGAIPVVGTLEAGHHSEVISHPPCFPRRPRSSAACAGGPVRRADPLCRVPCGPQHLSSAAGGWWREMRRR